MKMLCLSVMMFLVAVSVNAQTNLNTCLEYMTTNAPNSSWMLQDDGQGVYIRHWVSSIPKPTLEEARAVWPQASVWKKNVEDTGDANYEAWTKREKALCRLFVKEINKLRVKDGDAPYTLEQVKAALKAEMD